MSPPIFREIKTGYIPAKPLLHIQSNLCKFGFFPLTVSCYSIEFLLLPLEKIESFHK